MEIMPSQIQVYNDKLDSISSYFSTLLGVGLISPGLVGESVGVLGDSGPRVTGVTVMLIGFST